MFKQFRNLFLSTAIGCGIVLSPFSLWAQSNQMQGEMSGTRKQVATIIFAGLGGAVLGLSTLSFYSRPQDKLSNIGVGAAVGVVVGTVYTTYKAIHEPYEKYNVYERIYLEDQKLRTHFTDLNQNRWAQNEKTPTKISWEWSF